MSEPNGNGKSRLDRIEEMIERSERRNQAAHEEFQAAYRDLLSAQQRHERANEVAHEEFKTGHKDLLRAQILMNGAMQKMAEGMTSLELKMEETTGKLNALIDTVDGIIRNKAT